jgi:hypothetical protein
LQRLLSVIDKVEHLERYWREEDAFLQASLNAFDKGLIEIEEDQKRNLAIIRIDDAVLPRANLDRATSWVSQVIHPMAIHNRTDAMRILVIKGGCKSFIIAMRPGSTMLVASCHPDWISTSLPVASTSLRRGAVDGSLMESVR